MEISKKRELVLAGGGFAFAGAGELGLALVAEFAFFEVRQDFTCLVHASLRLRDLFLQPLGNPNLDDRLTGDPHAVSFPVEGMDHPSGELHIHTALFLIDPPGLGKVKILGDVVASIEFLIQFFSFHRVLALLFASA